jgi:predicted RNase H-like nuclease
MNRSYRVPYKVARSKRYWRDLSLAERHTRLLDAFSEILAALETSLHGVGLHLSITNQGTSLVRLKQYEDTLDALVCAWVGAKYLAGEAEPYGDETAAIWVPRPQSPGV